MTDTQNTAPERIWAWNWEVDRSRGQWALNRSIGFDGEAEYLRADVAQAMVAAALEEAADMFIQDLNSIAAESGTGSAEFRSCRDDVDRIRALIQDPSILAQRDARMKAEGMREAAGLIKPPKFCLPNQVDRVEAMHEMRHAILARAEEIEKGEG